MGKRWPEREFVHEHHTELIEDTQRIGDVSDSDSKGLSNSP